MTHVFSLYQLYCLVPNKMVSCYILISEIDWYLEIDTYTNHFGQGQKKNLKNINNVKLSRCRIQHLKYVLCILFICIQQFNPSRPLLIAECNDVLVSGPMKVNLAES